MIIDENKLSDIVLETLRRQLAVELPLDPLHACALLGDAKRFDAMVTRVARNVAQRLVLEGTPTCAVCGRPTHPNLSDDEGRCAQCGNEANDPPSGDRPAPRLPGEVPVVHLPGDEVPQ